MEALAILGVLVLGAVVLNLRSRVSKIERLQRHGQMQAPSPTPIATASASASASALPTAPLSAPPQVAPVLAAPSADTQLIGWLKENWLMKLGALLLLIGFGWLVSYAFLNNWIGPVGRITLGLVFGALVLLLGAWRMRAFVTQGSVFVALGATILLLTIYAARSTYDFFTPTSALTLMFVTSALVSFVSGVYNRKQLAVVGVALALFAPLLTNSPTQDYVGLFAYLMAVVLGAVWVVAWKGFREVTTVALVGVVLYSLPLLFGFASADMSLLLLFVYALAGIFYITHTAGLLRLRGTDAVPDLVTAAGSALLLLAWIYNAAPKDFQSLILAAWATAFIVGAFVVFRLSGQKAPLYLYAAIGVGYIAAATAIELDGAVLTIAYTLEAAAVSIALFGITKNVALAQRFALLLAGPAILSLMSMISDEWQHGVFNQHFFVLAVLAATFGVLGGLFYKAARETNSKDVKNVNGAIFVIGSIYLYVLLWLSVHAALPMSPDTATMIALLVYTVIGIAAYVRGFAETNKGMRMYGGVLLMLVVGRLLLVDVWQMELTGKILTFLLIGTLLMSTAFLGRKKKEVASAASDSTGGTA